MVFVLIQHLDPSHQNLTAELLSRQTEPDDRAESLLLISFNDACEAERVPVVDAAAGRADRSPVASAQRRPRARRLPDGD